MGFDGKEAGKEGFPNGEVADGDGHGGIGGGEAFQIAERGDGIGGRIIQEISGRVATGDGKFGNGLSVGTGTED